MNTELHYNNSPLIEAVIDFRVTLPEHIKVESLAQVGIGQEPSYPQTHKHFQGQVELAIGDEVTTTATGTHNGFVFVSTDERQIAQARLDGFTFSRRAPYENWYSFRDEARRWWDIYRTMVQPEEIGRIAVRYINRLDLPLPLTDFKDYLRIAPEIPPDLPQGLSGYFIQLKIPQDDAPVMLILSQAMAPQTSPEVVSIILDIDLSQGMEVPQDEDTIWSMFEWLRTRKNQIFEKSITDRMKELIR
jgi:uncharacterized protein (TIGR04255 family)